MQGWSVYVSFSSCQRSSSILLNSQQCISFPCNMLIRCNIRWDLFLLRAQNLVQCLDLWLACKVFSQIVFFSCHFHLDMKPRVLIMQSHIFFSLYSKLITFGDKVGNVVLCFHSCSELGAKKTIAAYTHMHSSCCQLPRSPVSFLSSRLSR